MFASFLSSKSPRNVLPDGWVARRAAVRDRRRRHSLRYIRLSKEDDRVFLYYAPRGKYVFCVRCRHLNGDGFIITAYLTDRIKKGVTVYEADSDHL